MCGFSLKFQYNLTLGGFSISQLSVTICQQVANNFFSLLQQLASLLGKFSGSAEPGFVLLPCIPWRESLTSMSNQQE